MDEVLWTQKARRDLDEIGSYIALDGPRSAENVVRRIVETVGLLAYHPKLGRIGRDETTREIVVHGTPYIILYYRLSPPRARGNRHDLSRLAQVA